MRWAPVRILLVLLFACNNKSSKESSAAPPQSADCVRELTAAVELSKSGLKGLATKDIKPTLQAALEKVGTACSALHKNETCKRAMVAMAGDLDGEGNWRAICREAYCAEISPEPQGCSGDGDWGAVQSAALARDWGDKAASAIAAEISAAGLRPEELTRNFMRQVDELASNSLDLENFEFPPAEFKAGGELENEIAVELVGAGGILRPEGGDEVEVSSPDGWAPALQKLSAEGFAPERTGIVFIAGEVNYQAVITAMDSVIAAGYTQIAIGSGSKDGDPKDADSAPTEAIDLKKEPVIVISKTDVRINGTVISALDELERGDARQALVQRLAASQPAPRAVIVQADKDASFTAVLATIDAIREAGIDDVRFAVDRQ